MQTKFACAERGTKIDCQTSARPLLRHSTAAMQLKTGQAGMGGRMWETRSGKPATHTVRRRQDYGMPKQQKKGRRTSMPAGRAAGLCDTGGDALELAETRLAGLAGSAASEKLGDCCCCIRMARCKIMDE
jgi:hypothetical protein